jgi:hypothetical protein
MFAQSYAIPDDGQATLERFADPGAFQKSPVPATAAARSTAWSDPADAFWDDRFDSLGGLNNTVYSMALDDAGVYVGGLFTAAGGAPANCIAKWDGVDWHALGSGLDNNVRAIVIRGTDLYASGQFTRAGDVVVNGVARWDGTYWHPLGSGMNGIVYALAFYGGDLYAGGLFTTAGGVNALNIARWDGSAWHAVGPGLNDYVFAFALRGGALIAAGDFTAAGTDSAHYVASWDGSTWSPLGAGLNSYVLALATDGSNVYAGGHFTKAGGVDASRIARWDGSAWSAVGSGVNDYVFSLTMDGPAVYAGGYFTLVEGAPANYLAKYEAGSWSSLGSGTNGYSVFALGVLNGSLYVGGTHTRAGEKPSMHFGRYGASPYVIRSSAGPGGSIAPSGNVEVEHGMNADFLLTPEIGMLVDSILVDEVYVGSARSYLLAHVAANHAVRVSFLAGNDTVKMHVQDGWNMVSVPLAVNDHGRASIFQSSVSSAFAFEGMYVITDSLENGVGYWLKFSGAHDLLLKGLRRVVDSIQVQKGWNLVGGTSVRFPTQDIVTNPGGLVASPFFGFTDAYAVADTLRPGSAYWVKMSRSGMLVLASSGDAGSENLIRIVATSERPPAPPGSVAPSVAPLPEQFALAQNYPNPFNPSTEIRYELPVRSAVKITVYSIIGVPVATLVDGEQEPGIHMISWRPHVSSGIYLYRMEAVGTEDPAVAFQKMSRMVYLK